MLRQKTRKDDWPVSKHWTSLSRSGRLRSRNMSAAQPVAAPCRGPDLTHCRRRWPLQQALSRNPPRPIRRQHLKCGQGRGRARRRARRAGNGRASFWRKLNGSGRWRRWRSGITRRRWWRRRVARADLHRPPRITNDTAQTVVHRLGCPVAARSVYRLGVTGIHHVAARLGCDNRASDHGTAYDPCRDSGSPPATPPSPPAPLGRGIRRSRGQGGGERRRREQAGKRLLHRVPPHRRQLRSRCAT
jgi:hypothetical protein